MIFSITKKNTLFISDGGYTMKTMNGLLAGIFALLVLLFFGCSKIDNPTGFDNDEKQSSTTLQKKTNTEFLDDDLKEFSDRADESSSGTQSSGTVLLHYFNGIDDVTEVGGFPTMEFAAWSKSTDFLLIPENIKKISAFVEARWRYIDETEWKPLWEDKDEKTDWYHASVGARTFMKKNNAWTAQSRSEHKYEMYIHQGGQIREVYTYPISCTAYFIERDSK